MTTKVKSPDTDDYKKLARVMKYLWGTRNLTFTLEAESLNVVKWWVDASFAVHSNYHSHTGITISLGKGLVYSGSTRQNLNTKSSTEAELVGVDRTREFLKAQGHDVLENVVHQDNMSAIPLENNGQRSSGKRTQHINIRYFFASDRIKAGEMSVKYCPTSKILRDFFTKPLQGKAFKEFRKLVLNDDDEETEQKETDGPKPEPSWDPRSVLDGKSIEEKENEAKDGPRRVSR